MPRWPKELNSDDSPEGLERWGTRILECERVGKYQQDKRDVTKGLRGLAVTDEEIRQALRLTAEEIRNLHEMAAGKRKGRDKRNMATELGALKLLLDATVEKPKQTVEGSGGVNVVVHTYRKEPYEMPAATSTAALPSPEGSDAK